MRECLFKTPQGEVIRNIMARKGWGVNRGKVELKLISIITVIRLADICLKVLNYIVIRLVVKQRHATYKAAEEPAKRYVTAERKKFDWSKSGNFFVFICMCVCLCVCLYERNCLHKVINDFSLDVNERGGSFTSSLPLKKRVMIL